MCRWLTYFGDPIYLEELIYEPDHSLVAQSRHAEKAKVPTNGDGFGIGWYQDRAFPGVYREVLPAWNDRNLRSLAHQIKAKLFFAHVRASTGTETIRPNCHPFSHGRWLFMHNGQIGGYARVRRRLEALIPDRYYEHRRGTTDSELIFMLLLANELDRDPVEAIGRMIEQVETAMAAEGITAPLRLDCGTDGRTEHIRSSVRERSPSPIAILSSRPFRVHHCVRTVGHDGRNMEAAVAEPHAPCNWRQQSGDPGNGWRAQCRHNLKSARGILKLALLEIENMTVEFGPEDAPFRAVDSVSLSVGEGEVVGIVGESGSGKSVTSLSVMGLIDYPGRVKADCVRFEDMDLLSVPAKQRREIVGRDMAMIFQEPHVEPQSLLYRRIPDHGGASRPCRRHPA